MYKKSRLVRVRGLDGRSTFGAMGEAEVVSARGYNILHLRLFYCTKPKWPFLCGFLLINVASILLVKFPNCRRGSGGRGFISGAGETELQLQRRRSEFVILNIRNLFGTPLSFRTNYIIENDTII